MKKIVIAGGTGFLGKVLTEYLVERAYQVVVLSRRHYENTPWIQYVQWDGVNLGPWASHLEGAEALINLAGRTVNCRYTKKNKREIYDSRIQSTLALGMAIETCDNPPNVWINSSTATIYRHETERPNTEGNGIYGHGFSVDVAEKWEAAFNGCYTPMTRKVALRTAIVLGYEGEAFKIYKAHAYLGLSNRHGNGKQMISWLHETDFVRIVEFIITNKDLVGPINAAAPNAINNKAFLKTTRLLAKMPLGIPLMKWMVKLGAFIVGTEAELTLKSRWVYPEKLLNHGFKFIYENVDHALCDLFNGKLPYRKEAQLIMNI